MHTHSSRGRKISCVCQQVSKHPGTRHQPAGIMRRHPHASYHTPLTAGPPKSAQHNLPAHLLSWSAAELPEARHSGSFPVAPAVCHNNCWQQQRQPKADKAKALSPHCRVRTAPPSDCPYVRHWNCDVCIDAWPKFAFAGLCLWENARMAHFCGLP